MIITKQEKNNGKMINVQLFKSKIKVIIKKKKQNDEAHKNIFNLTGGLCLCLLFCLL